MHAPFALRTIVEVLTDNGLIGLAETYGGEAPLRALERAKASVVGRDPWQLAPLRAELEGANGKTPEGFAWESRSLAGPALFSAIEVACLDVLGQATGRPVADLLGGRVRDRVPFAAYLFFKHAGDDAWGEVMTPEALVAEARVMVERYGYRSLKLKGGVLEPDVEAETILLLREAFGTDVPLRIDPNAAWSVPTSVRIAKKLAGALEYLEDPVPGIDCMSEVAREAPMPLATNMCVTEFAHLAPAVAKHAIDVLLTDHHMWGGLRATVELGRICGTFGLGVSMHSNSHLGISLAAMVHVAAAVPELTYACDTHYPWQTDEVIAGGKLPIVKGEVAVPDGPGLGVKLDRDALGRLNEQYQRAGLTKRDDVTEIRRTIPDWRPHKGDW
ncbi:MAG TPA: enolase C-terminal domain-like protein [Methylomirabilota bacterium]|nr:enolase C-terminal domain-like protein [Methylomirabilota bacterium]